MGFNGGVPVKFQKIIPRQTSERIPENTSEKLLEDPRKDPEIIPEEYFE